MLGMGLGGASDWLFVYYLAGLFLARDLFILRWGVLVCIVEGGIEVSRVSFYPAVEVVCGFVRSIRLESDRTDPHLHPHSSFLPTVITLCRLKAVLPLFPPTSSIIFLATSPLPPLPQICPAHL